MKKAKRAWNWSVYLVRTSLRPLRIRQGPDGPVTGANWSLINRHSNSMPSLPFQKRLHFSDCLHIHPCRGTPDICRGFSRVYWGSIGGRLGVHWRSVGGCLGVGSRSVAVCWRMGPSGFHLWSVGVNFFFMTLHTPNGRIPYYAVPSQSSCFQALQNSGSSSRHALRHRLRTPNEAFLH